MKMKKPNIILISIDTLRADHLSCSGYQRNTTPNIDALAKDGIRFTDASSTAVWTPPCHASILTGVYPNAHGVLDQNKLNRNVPTIAELLRDNGYQTAGFVNNSQVGELVGLNRGHEHFTEVWKGYAKSEIVAHLLHKSKKAFGYADHGAAKTNNYVFDWLYSGREKDKPFYLFVHYIDPHNPLRAPKPFLYKYLSKALRKKVNMEKVWSVAENPLICHSDGLRLSEDEIEALTALYDEEIAYIDAMVGRLMALVAGMKLVEDTIVILTADHGEHLGERQKYSHVASLYQPILNIPLIISRVGEKMSAKVVQAPVQHIDIVTTIAKQANVQLPENIPYTGLDLLGDWSNQNSQRMLFAEWEGRVPYFVQGRSTSAEAHENYEFMRKKMWMCRQGQLKLITDGENHELFDLAKDPCEENNIAAEQQENVNQLKSAIDNYKSVSASSDAEVYDYQEGAVREHLKALGYL